ncbi:MAG: Mrp/NBP35 family ATP-binding protein [Euryarchaeota archaeon]|nr:Mrp/NBP35 family ATP-binding protein [Euryarchaeota archaeon]
MDPRIQQQQALVASRLKDIKHVLIVMSGKGGVGKSTVASGLAVRLSERGKKVGILDMDLTGPDLPKFLGRADAKVTNSERGGMAPVKVNDNLVLMSLAYLIPDEKSSVVWRGPMKMGAIRQMLTDVDWGKLDYLVIDLPPGTSDEPLSVAQSIPDADGCILVTTPHSVSILDVMKSIDFGRKLGMHMLGLVENMSGLECPHCHEGIDLFGKGLGKELAEEFEVPFLGAVAIDPDAASDGGRASVPAVLRDGSKAAKEFDAVVDRVEEEVGKRPPRKAPKGLGLPMAR